MALKSNATIIYFIIQMVPALIIRSYLWLAPVFCQQVPTLLSTSIFSDQDIPSSYYIVLAPALESISS